MKKPAPTRKTLLLLIWSPLTLKPQVLNALTAISRHISPRESPHQYGNCAKTLSTKYYLIKNKVFPSRSNYTKLSHLGQLYLSGLPQKHIRMWLHDTLAAGKCRFYQAFMALLLQGKCHIQTSSRVLRKFTTLQRYFATRPL